MMNEHKQLTIIKATEAHAEDLHALFTAANAYKVNHGDTSWEPGFSKRGVDWMIGLGTTYVALTKDAASGDQEMVGTVDLKWEDEEGWDELERNDAGYIGRLAVKDTAHGQNIGGQLIDWAEDQVRQNERQHLRLDCVANNKSLCGYYEKQGFTLVRTKQFTVHDTPTALFQRKV